MLDRPSWLKIPEIPVKVAIGDASVPVTEGIKVIPERTIQSGYKFQFEFLDDALKNIL
ncbi:MAG: DUF1731 domain-containing protein [Clostridiales bacterium]